MQKNIDMGRNLEAWNLGEKGFYDHVHPYRVGSPLTFQSPTSGDPILVVYKVEYEEEWIQCPGWY